jgi:hypothetical protein
VFHEEDKFYEKELSGMMEREFGQNMMRVDLSLCLGTSFLRSVLSALRRLGVGCKATAPLSSLTAI